MERQHFIQQKNQRFKSSVKKGMPQIVRIYRRYKLENINLVSPEERNYK